ncbi:hypothetical protein Salat_1031300 [Sesamum alatum]|uniref:Ribosomal RNA-processing protein 14 N-terminal domain-containing protein n=1 Tax=Sesamum alatum TaxID=300844 RepID=A0AAE1YMU2_9LAMI|nr:hypothetical protein Salat_1031300 [Sesamum alatum]
MKKKKQSQPPQPRRADGDGDEFSGDLKSIIHAHSEYFDHLIELIPARFYLSNDDADSKPWNLPPTLQLLKNNKTAKTPVSDEGDLANLEDSESGAKPIDVEENKEKSVTYEELRENCVERLNCCVETAVRRKMMKRRRRMMGIRGRGVVRMMEGRAGRECIQKRMKMARR